MTIPNKTPTPNLLNNFLARIVALLAHLFTVVDTHTHPHTQITGWLLLDWEKNTTMLC